MDLKQLPRPDFPIRRGKGMGQAKALESSKSSELQSEGVRVDSGCILRQGLGIIRSRTEALGRFMGALRGKLARLPQPEGLACL